MNTETTAPAGVVSSDQLGKWAERAAFENWYSRSPAQGWYGSDQAYAAWCAAINAERERCANQLEALGCDHCAAALRRATHRG